MFFYLQINVFNIYDSTYITSPYISRFSKLLHYRIRATICSSLSDPYISHLTSNVSLH